LTDSGRAAASAPPAPPSGPPAEAADVKAGLEGAGFTGAGVRGALEAEHELLSQALEIAVHERRLARVPPPLATLIRLFLLDLPVEAAAVEDALGAHRADRLAGLGLVAGEGDAVRARVRIVPQGDLLIASDRFGAAGPDHVAGVHRPSATLANLTVRRQVRSALDVGTGCGIQALLAAEHCERVVATDLNERALAFAAFNAALNGRRNIEFRAGSFFEPAQRERFELVVCNPPYVISPETSLVFRDSGLPGDTLSAQLLATLPEHVADDGFGTIMISWSAGDDPTERPRAWLEGSACDAWLLHTATEEPLAAAAAWARAAGPDPGERYAERLDAWVDYYRRLEIAAIAYGAAVVHRRVGAGHWVRTAHLPSTRLKPASAHLQQLFAAQDLLHGEPAEALLDRRFGLVEHAFLDRTQRVEGGRWAQASAAVRLEAGIGFRVNLDVAGAALVSALDGAAPMREIVPMLAAELGLPERDLTVFAAQLLEHLIERGFAIPL
jgi:Methyltransferase small domain